MTGPEARDGEPEDAAPKLRAASGWDWGADANAAASGVPGDGDSKPDDFALSEADRYQTGGLLGRGAMGEVIAATDGRLGRRVARKSLAIGATASVADVARLRHEAQIAARLDHPGIVAIHDAGLDAAGQPFYTMRLLPGRTLADAISAAETLGERMRLLRQLLPAIAAIGHAHRQGIIHRDLKPENLLLDESGVAQVGDFGLALDLRDDVDRRAAKAVVGTPGYMAPELLSGPGAGADARSDVYALGRTLQALFSPAGAIDEAPAELQAILAKSTARSPAERYADAGALLEDLEALVDGRAVAAYRYSPRQQLQRLMRAWRAPLRVAAVAFLLLIAVVAFAFFSLQRERDRALQAEASATSARAAADRALGAALLTAAEGHLAAGRLLEAEAPAARALAISGALAPADVARGRAVLASTMAMARPSVVATLTLPERCHALAWARDEEPGATGDAVLCRGAGSLALLDLSVQGAVRWRHPSDARDARLDAEGVWATLGGEVARLGPGGDVRSQALPTMGGSGWQPGPSRLHGALAALRLGGGFVSLQRAAAESAIDLPLCGTSTAMAAAIWRDGGGLSVICSDATLIELPIAATALEAAPEALAVAAGARRRETPFGSAHRGAIAIAEATGALPGSPRTWLIGCHDGMVGTFTADPGAPVGWQRDYGLGQVRALDTARGAPNALVVGEQGVGVVRVEDGALLLRLSGQDAAFAVPAAAARPGGDIEPEIWLRDGAELQRLRLPSPMAPWLLPPGPPTGLTSLAFEPNGERLALADGRGRVRVFRTRDGVEVGGMPAAEGVTKAVAFAIDGSRLSAALAGEPGLRSLDRALRPRPEPKINGRRRVIELAGGWRLLLSYSSSIDVVPPDAAAPWQALGQELGAGLDGAASADGRLACAVDVHGALVAFEVEGAAMPRMRRVATLPGGEVCEMDPSRRALIAAKPGFVQAFSLQDGSAGPAYAIEGERIFDLALAPTGDLLAVATLSGGVHVLRWPSGQPVAVLRSHTQRVSAVAFSPDGRWLCSTGWDGAARWHAVAGLRVEASDGAGELAPLGGSAPAP